MMDDNQFPFANPYQAPSTTGEVDFVEVSDDDPSRRLSERTVEALAGTQSWVRIVAWLSLLIGVLVCVRSLLMVRRIPQMGVLAGWSAAMSLFVGGMYSAGGVLLMRYSSSIGDFVISRRVEHLDRALEAQRTFWRFLGVTITGMMILLLGALVLFFLGAGAAAIGERFLR